MVSLFNKREINRRIVVSPLSGWARQKSEDSDFQVKHDIPGEQITCLVPTLEIGACIVKALRERMYLKLAQQKLNEHMRKKRSK